MWQTIIDYFTPVSYLRILDVALVLLLLYQLYRAVRESIAFNLFIGMLLIYLLWRLVHELDMPLMDEFFDGLVKVGLVGLIVLFQPELRKFLINIGRRPVLGSQGLLKRFFQSSGIKKYIAEEEIINETMEGILRMKHEKTGGVIVIALSDKYQLDTNSGVLINGLVSSELILSVFAEDSPLKNGAIVIDNNQMLAAGVTLPISNSQKISASKGLRHRAAVGVTEHGEVIAIVISAVDGEISLAKNGVLKESISLEHVKQEMYRALVAG
jgi:diadenylate cyclase